ncbi:MAG: VanZ family protein [Defluviitaleaceae bacterium]|nr:VanZ family protein [Defluviitaleaceae bacterium]
MTKIIWPVLSFLVAAGIFFSSSLSGEVSGYASMAIAQIVRDILPLEDASLSLFNFIVRKTAHFVVFFVLAFCVAHSLKFHVHRLRFLLLWAWGIASVYGVLDEIHQYFIPGRVMDVNDMIINSVGAFAGAALVVWYVKSFKKLRRL